MRRLLDFDLGYPYCLYIPELGEEIIIAVQPVLLDGDVQGFIPTEVVALKQRATDTKTRVVVSYDDELLSSFNPDTNKADRPLCREDIICTITEPLRLQWLQSYVESRLN